LQSGEKEDEKKKSFAGNGGRKNPGFGRNDRNFRGIPIGGTEKRGGKRLSGQPKNNLVGLSASEGDC